jgi:hypothetical protein
LVAIVRIAFAPKMLPLVIVPPVNCGSGIENTFYSSAALLSVCLLNHYLAAVSLPMKTDVRTE